MKGESNTDNVYPEGSIIYAKADPALKLVIDKYKQRIYYCAVFGQSDPKRLAYFERELIPPGSVEQGRANDAQA